jgi:sugar O-acyltransferase (sialic acid O-acetyltransferase NeuD family)
MKDLIIYGAGGFGRETALMIEQINEDKKQWNVIGFIDDQLSTHDHVDGLQILGNKKQLEKFPNADIVIAIADPIARANIVSNIHQETINFPILIHPDASVGSKANKIGKGAIITAGCRLTTGVSIHEFVIINLLTSIGHDVTIDNYSSIMPGCNISGNVKIGERVLLGTGAKVLQNISIGSNCKIGAGAVVTRNIHDGKTVVGIPAKEVVKKFS